MGEGWREGVCLSSGRFGIREMTGARDEKAPSCVVKEQRMEKGMLDELIFHATEAVSSEMDYTDVASHIKRQMTASYTGVWHVIVGRNFSGSFTHQENNSAYLHIGQTGICCFRTV